MFGIGGFELFIIVVFAFVIFGPDKLPEITKIAGRFIRKFRNAKAEMDSVLQEEVIDPVMAEANKPEKPNEEKKKEENGAGDASNKPVSKPIPDNAEVKLQEELKKQKEDKEKAEKSSTNSGQKKSSSKKKPSSNKKTAAKKPAAKKAAAKKPAAKKATTKPKAQKKGSK